MIPFFRPLIDQDVHEEVTRCLFETGWLTSGPIVNKFEKALSSYIGNHNLLCVNSWTSGAMLVLKWFGVGDGDEVLIPSYTYSATALAVLNLNARPILIDVDKNFLIDTKKIEEKINHKTKAIIPVDLGGFPASYSEITSIVNKQEIINKFQPNCENQKLLNRILILSDSAHSLGATYGNNKIGNHCDFSVFSFHSVKNITTGEGGAVSFKLPKNFNQQKVLKHLKCLSMNGQTRSALEKNNSLKWKYDIIDQGLKINMPDINAAIGLAQLKKYEKELLPERKEIFTKYYDRLGRFSWIDLPVIVDELKESSYHLFMVRIKNFNENQRDKLIGYLASHNIGVNVHYIPMPDMSLFKNLGYKKGDYPNTYKLYENEITLPVYNGLSNAQIDQICSKISEGYELIK